jgi:mRNA interferase MazF
VAKFIKGDIVVVLFPFSNLSQVKKRPAFVIKELAGDDIILCQITSQAIKDKYSLALTEKDFISGSLSVASNIRPNRIFTADRNIIFYKIGGVRQNITKDVIKKIVRIIES